MIPIFTSEFLMNGFPWYATELFLRVCEAGGLSAASRFGKTGISQPALSAQMKTLEDHLGKKLFHRKPFALTEEGRLFREEARRMQARMVHIREALADDPQRPLRIAASDVVIRDHLPTLLKQLDPSARMLIVLREAPSQNLAALVRDGEADLAIGMLSRHVGSGTQPLVEKLAKLPIQLLVPPSFAKTVRNWQDLTRLLRKPGSPGLVALPADNLLMQHLASSLRRHGLEWPPTVEVSSIGHVTAYVDLDFGFGFGVDLQNQSPARKRTASMVLPANKIPPLKLGIWHGEDPPPLAKKLLQLIRQHAAAVTS